MYFDFHTWAKLLQKFSIEIGLMDVDNIIATELSSIEQFEQEQGVMLGDGLKLYFQFFGNPQVFNCKYFLPEIYYFESAVDFTRNTPEKHEILEAIKLNPGRFNLKKQEINLSDIFVLNHYETVPSTMFVLLGSSNPNIWYYEDKIIRTPGFTIMNEISRQYILSILGVIHDKFFPGTRVDRNYNIDYDKLLSISWVKFYKEYMHSDMSIMDRIISYTTETILKIDKKEGLLMEFEHLQIEIIQHIIANKKLAVSRDVFDYDTIKKILLKKYKKEIQ